MQHPRLLIGRPGLSTLLLLAVPAASWLWLASAGCSGGAAAGPPASPEPAKQPPAGWVTHTDSEQGFSIAYPRAFTVRRQDVARLPRFTPMPLASTLFMNPTMAAGSLAGIEPPDLEVRVYRAEAAESLEGWLISAAFATTESLKTARPARVSGHDGLKVCQSTMVAPGCSTFLLSSGRVFQLTPATVEGEAMIETFSWSAGR